MRIYDFMCDDYWGHICYPMHRLFFVLHCCYMVLYTSIEVGCVPIYNLVPNPLAEIYAVIFKGSISFHGFLFLGLCTCLVGAAPFH